MSARYEYDLDHNGEWRWIAIAESGQVSAVSPAGFRHLQDCMHAVALLRDPGGFAVLPGASAAPAPAAAAGTLQRPASAQPGMSLSRLQVRPAT